MPPMLNLYVSQAPMTKDERKEAIKAMFHDGKTMQEIGDEYGITRERVRQILKKLGIVYKDGGAHVRGLRVAGAKLNKRRSVRNLRTLAYYGCTHAEALNINGGMILSMPGSPADTYKDSRRSAIKNGFGWEITLPEWWDIWASSGKWAKRGRDTTHFAMYRKDEQLPFRPDNLEILRFGEGIARLRKREAARGRYK